MEVAIDVGAQANCLRLVLLRRDTSSLYSVMSSRGNLWPRSPNKSSEGIPSTISFLSARMKISRTLNCSKVELCGHLTVFPHLVPVPLAIWLHSRFRDATLWSGTPARLRVALGPFRNKRLVRTSMISVQNTAASRAIWLSRATDCTLG